MNYVYFMKRNAIEYACSDSGTIGRRNGKYRQLWFASEVSFANWKEKLQFNRLMRSLQEIGKDI